MLLLTALDLSVIQTSFWRDTEPLKSLIGTDDVPIQSNQFCEKRKHTIIMNRRMAVPLIAFLRVGTVSASTGEVRVSTCMLSVLNSEVKRGTISIPVACR